MCVLQYWPCFAVHSLKTGETKGVGEVGYLFMCVFVSHLSQTPSCNVCTILYMVSYQALVAMMKQMCGEGLFCVGWVVGPRTIKPCDLAGQMLIFYVRLMPHNWRNLHYFHCSSCTCPLTNVVFSPSGKSLPFLLFLNNLGMVLYGVVLKDLKPVEKNEAITVSWMWLVAYHIRAFCIPCSGINMFHVSEMESFHWMSVTLSNTMSLLGFMELADHKYG